MRDLSDSIQRAGRRFVVPLLGLALFLGACYPGDIEGVGELDVVITTHDEAVNFAGFQTFAIPDSVVQLGADEQGAVELSHAFDSFIVAQVVSRLEALGYVRELDPLTNGADLVVLASAVATRETEAYVSYPWYDYWGFYPGWGFWPPYGPGWGYGYPGSVSVVSYEQGTLFIDMIDPNDPDLSQEELPIAWTAAIRGLLGDGAGATQARLTQTIDRAFDQSPYLGR